MTFERKDFYIIGGSFLGIIGASMAINQYNKSKERACKEKEIENQKLYFSKLTSEQVEQLEREKLVVKKAEIEYNTTVAEKQRSEIELKKTVTDFKDQIQNELRREVKQGIDKDMRKTFDSWSARFEDRLDGKVDRVVERIDKLSDKYGGVKTASSTTPSIQVVNAPNN